MTNEELLTEIQRTQTARRGVEMQWGVPLGSDDWRFTAFIAVVAAGMMALSLLAPMTPQQAMTCLTIAIAMPLLWCAIFIRRVPADAT